jgi:8-oxo-dGTP pyrophosphatase MutT (NUDIX family)
MRTRSDISYGIIPVRWTGANWETLLIHQYSKIGKNSYWVFPKGHPEGDETPLETAARELHEETGLSLERIVEEPQFIVSYAFTFEAERIEKQVVFFIGHVAEGEMILDSEEVVEARWFSLPAAAEQLDYDDTKAMFTEVREYLKTHANTG